ncbi:uncharacterized protein ACHE_30277S [Aspergillus chevalieri]|uniref:FAD/NAD(P)-binding domain-containing protein n=1 Tax=Aspergillus chevalieri TaxID=182096 RepID=A0A7R7VKD2_ASPCH|nr:uncharacterized protein ACHE_30277S [Aspergillus chevalieri]BCR86290.1 hypothetical protein ACHE_30277S [Aspergillus chevalieri]
MTGPKKVAIIGAGPSGLVTAKILLHHHPNGTFAPVIFEKRHNIGGLWPSSPTAPMNNNEHHSTPLNENGRNGSTVGPLNPFMRTNLSRFTVAFSDLAWESVFEDTEVPMFPQAWQVGRYLERYAERFLPNGVLRLGQRVVQTSRKVGNGERRRWTIQWVESSYENENKNQEIHSEEYDLLIVAAGYFASPSIPEVPGLYGFMDRTIHSSSLHNAERLLRKCHGTGGKLVVIGGSLSGTEAASTLALHVSSSKFTQEPTGKDHQVHHISTRPFWTIPAYLPRETTNRPSDKTVSFLPLDLVMYDLDRRPPGPVEYAFGPIPAQKAQKTNDFLHSLLGSDYGKFGNIRGYNEQASQPPWVSIGNDYAEYVRSGAVIPTIGRVSAVQRGHNSELATIDIKLPDGETTTLDNVAAIVLATGFTPYNSLSFLPSPVLSLLEYSEKDPFIPIVLDGKGTMHAEIPDIGFVGFYRGPYWGVMEMQARHVAASWTRAEAGNCEVSLKKKEEERQRIRGLRNMDTQLYRGQFPMGDYVGLMESFASELGMARTPLLQLVSGEGKRSGPALPARYTFASGSSTERDIDRAITLNSLRSILSPDEFQTSAQSTATATSTAIFRALHGTWKTTRTNNNRTTHGKATFHPRYPTSSTYENEYLYQESEFVPEQQTSSITQATLTKALANRSVYRLRAPERDKTIGPNMPRILVWSVDVAKDPNTAARLSHGINSAMVAERYIDQRVEEGKEACLGRYTVHAVGSVGKVAQYERREYTFHFQGVSILSWECCVKTDERCIGTMYERD